MSDASRRAARRRTVARHGRLRRSNAALAVLKLLGAIVAVSLVASASVVGIAVGTVSHNVIQHQVKLGDPVVDIPSIGAASGAVNLLLVGSDTRDGQKGHYGANPGSTLNDVNILIHISQDHTKADVISFPRDLYVDVPACTDPKDPSRTLPAETGVKINTTLYSGGPACVRDTVAKLTGIKIPYLALITFDGVVEMSNAVGGVQVCVAKAINDQYTELHLSKGEHTLQGATALKFLRTRHGVGDGSDLTRISSQQVFLSSLVRKLKAKSTLTDLTKLYGIASVAGSSMTLSSSLANIDTMVTIGRALAPIDLNKVVFVQYPTVLQGDGVVVNTKAAGLLMKAVKEDKSLRLKKAPKGDAVGSDVKSSSSSSTSSGDTVDLPSGVLGQTAAQTSCSVGNDLGNR